MTDTASGLGEVLRGWRDRLSPVDAGLPTGPRRRTQGLRREELAQLAGVSVDYLVRLEQGRATTPSAQITAALARALQLDSAERNHLYRCAGLLPPEQGTIDRHVSPGIARLVGRLADTPVAVFAADWDLLSWNPMWSALQGHPAAIDPRHRNLVRVMFGNDDRARVSYPPFTSTANLEHLATALVADLRVAAVRFPDDAPLTTLISELRSQNTYFDTLWRSGTAGQHATDRKTIHHDTVGDITLDCDVLNAPGSDLRIVVYTAAAGSSDAEKLEFLRVAAGVATAGH
ncbi:helix-turn-helix transcriptional regulator [Rhodococcus sp. P1Y]|uniref:helix-turn-helix transcriptional regulator n=1 Tax=Rhodococcus sp. P1Y TaxID=1302308 RepID=UPI000EB332AC|nr:helix-turn-helix transcriptional regulator [Rhodococcus sp. P1Y]AYJ49581.1 XRE family transcriptional regulator [Rhodococcus sp. P1Y]